MMTQVQNLLGMVQTPNDNADDPIFPRNFVKVAKTGLPITGRCAANGGPVIMWLCR